MSDFDEAVSGLDIALFNEFGISARYQGSKSVQVIIDRDVEQFGSYETTVSARRHEIAFLNAEIPDPKRGHTIEANRSMFVLDGEISNDGFSSRWFLNDS